MLNLSLANSRCTPGCRPQSPKPSLLNPRLFVLNGRDRLNRMWNIRGRSILHAARYGRTGKYASVLAITYGTYDEDAASLD